MTVHHDNSWRSPFSRCLALLAMVCVTSLAVQTAMAGEEEAYPDFIANYIVRINGVKVGKATFSLQRQDSGEYLYQQRSKSTGIGNLLGADESTQSSRWRYVKGEIQPLEYRSQRKKGDDDDNDHLFFDWLQHRVENRGAGEAWNIEIPDGTLDRLVMQMAMLFDLRDGKTQLEYHVATRSRIKRYIFEVTGKETIELPFGNFEAIRAERRDDKKDKSLVWGAPELDYFPVRFIKQKKSGIEVEILLQKLDFNPTLAQGKTD